MSVAMPAFNTLKYADELKAAGVPEAQARATVQMVADALDMNMSRLATKDDLSLLKSDLDLFETKLRGEMAQLSSELRGEMAQLSSELRGEITLVKWMAGPSLLGTLVTVVGVAALLIKNFA